LRTRLWWVDATWCGVPAMSTWSRCPGHTVVRRAGWWVVGFRVGPSCAAVRRRSSIRAASPQIYSWKTHAHSTDATDVSITAGGCQSFTGGEVLRYSLTGHNSLNSLTHCSKSSRWGDHYRCNQATIIVWWSNSTLWRLAVIYLSLLLFLSLFTVLCASLVNMFIGRLNCSSCSPSFCVETAKWGICIAQYATQIYLYVPLWCLPYSTLPKPYANPILLYDIAGFAATVLAMLPEMFTYFIVAK